jgi:hypothetical protein
MLLCSYAVLQLIESDPGINVQEKINKKVMQSLSSGQLLILTFLLFRIKSGE